MATKNMDYSFWIGLIKSFKNNFIIWAPALLAFLAGVPVEYTPTASFLAYLLKNWLEFETGRKL